MAVFLTPLASRAQETASTTLETAATVEPAALNTPPIFSAVEEMLVKKVAEAREILSNTSLNHKIYTIKGKYKKKTVYTKMLQREVAVIGLNSATGDLKQFIFKEDLKLSSKGRAAPKPPKIIGQDKNCKLVWRSGSRWGFNRNMQLTCDGTELIVMGLKMPYSTNSKSDGIVVDSYVPYSPELNTSLFAKIGREHLEKIIAKASSELSQDEVKSRAFPNKEITDIVPMEFVMSMIVNEHMDHNEFLKAVKDGTFPDLVNKVLVLVGLNREQAMKWSVSKAGACCLTQFMPRTYKSVVKRYPEAELDPAVLSGRQDHLNAVKASIILFDSDISVGWKAKTKETCFVSSVMLERCLAASYNAGPGTLNKAIRKLGFNWSDDRLSRVKRGLKTETRMYLKKLESIKTYIVDLVKNT